MSKNLRNPWHGINAWRELKYDLRHPLLWIQNVIANVNKVPKEMRVISWAIAVVGSLSFFLAIAMIIVGHLHGHGWL